MAERRRLRARDKGKAKVGEPSKEDEDFLSDQDDHQNVQDQNQPDNHDHDSDMLLPSKKPRTDNDEGDDDDEGPAPMAEDRIQNEQINAQKPDNPLDHILGNVPGEPGSRDLSAEPIFISKTLTSAEADPKKSRLYIDHDKARIMANDPNFDLVDYWFMKTILMFDSGDRPYLMDLSKCTNRGRIKHAIEGVGWEGFLLLHRLNGGDEVTIYRILDRNISDEHYYVLRFVKKQPPTKVEPSGDGGGDLTGWLRIGV